MKVTRQNDKILDSEGNHVGTVLKKSFRKLQIYCFLCDKCVTDLHHFEKDY